MAVSTSYPFIQLLSHKGTLFAICAGGHVWELQNAKGFVGDGGRLKTIHWKHCDWKRVSE